MLALRLTAGMAIIMSVHPKAPNRTDQRTGNNFLIHGLCLLHSSSPLSNIDWTKPLTLTEPNTVIHCLGDTQVIFLKALHGANTYAYPKKTARELCR